MSESIYTRADLVEDVAENTGLGKAQSKAAVASAISAIVAAVQRGQRVTIKEFARFEAVPTAERKGRNPRTGEPLIIPAGKRVSIKAAFPA